MKFIYHFLCFCIAIYTHQSQAQISKPHKKPYIITIYCDGGWDQTLVFDNKLTSTHVHSQPESTFIKSASGLNHISHPSRPSVNQFFDEHGAKAVIINGLSTQSLNHFFSRKNALSFSRSDLLFEQTEWLALYASVAGGTLKIPHVSINTKSLTSEFAVNSTHINTTLLKSHPLYQVNEDILSSRTKSSLNNFLSNRYAINLRNVMQHSIDDKKLMNLHFGKINEHFIYTNYESFPFDNIENQLTNDGYLAIDLMRKGFTQAVTLQAGKDREWDTHINHFQTQSILFESLFDSLNKILKRAEDEGILDDLTIIVASNLGRSPLLNKNNGKDHWPYTSTLLYGSHLKGGMVIGSTNDYLIANPINPTFGTKSGFDDIVIDNRHIFSAIFQFYNIPTSLIGIDIPALYYLMNTESSHE